MGKALIDYMEVCMTKDKLYDSLLPPARTVHMIKHNEDLSGTIETILNLTKNSIEQHQQPVHILLKTSNKSQISMRFPEFGLYSLIAAHHHSNRVAIMLNLLQTVLSCISTGVTKTNRDVFYSNVQLYGKQSKVDQWINTIAQNFELANARDALNVIPAQKGIVFTSQQVRVRTKDKVEVINPYHSTLIPHIDPNSVLEVLGLKSNEKIRLLVLEKEAVYNQLIYNHSLNDSKSYENCIIVTGKGYPDFLTRSFLHKLQNSTTAIDSWEIYTDADPYGVDIALKYIENVHQGYSCDKLAHRGAFLFQLMSSRQRQVQFLPMTQKDTAVAARVLQRVTELKPTRRTTIQELQRQIFLQKKAEMNAMNREDYWERRTKLEEEDESRQ